MEDLYQDFEKLQGKFHDTLHEYPLFEEQINDILDNDIKEIDDLLDKNDEYYMKKALWKLERLIDDIKDKSMHISELYDSYDKLCHTWDKMNISNTISNEKLDMINERVMKANSLIKEHDIAKLEDANKMFLSAIKELKEYTK